MAETRHHVHLFVGNAHFIPFLEPADGSKGEFSCILKGMVMVEFHMDGPRNLGSGRRGHQLRVEAFGHVRQTLHDALHINNHGLYGPGSQDHFLLNEAACYGNAASHLFMDPLAPMDGDGLRAIDVTRERTGVSDAGHVVKGSPSVLDSGSNLRRRGSAPFAST